MTPEFALSRDNINQAASPPISALEAIPTNLTNAPERSYLSGICPSQAPFIIASYIFQVFQTTSSENFFIGSNPETQELVLSVDKADSPG